MVLYFFEIYHRQAVVWQSFLLVFESFSVVLHKKTPQKTTRIFLCNLFLPLGSCWHGNDSCAPVVFLFKSLLIKNSPPPPDLLCVVQMIQEQTRAQFFKYSNPPPFLRLLVNLGGIQSSASNRSFFHMIDSRRLVSDIHNSQCLWGWIATVGEFTRLDPESCIAGEDGRSECVCVCVCVVGGLGDWGLKVVKP